MVQRKRRFLFIYDPELDDERVARRSDCLPGGAWSARPCQQSTCVHRLDDGRCVLDMVDDGSTFTLEEIGEMLGIVRERVRQIQEEAFTKLSVSTNPAIEEYKDDVLERLGDEG